MTYCRKPGNEPATQKENKTETKSEARQRRCLAGGCGRFFFSSWAGERICPDCRRGDRHLEGDNPFEEPVTFGHH